MSIKLRQEAILDILQKQGYVSVRYLTEVLHYSTATINRDLNALQNQNLIKRSYGGVELVKTKSVPLPFRYHKMKTEKRHIGKAAASFVQDGDTIFIDASTTTQYMAQYLIDKKDLTVITNNIALVAFLAEYKIRVICLGGEVVEIPNMLNGTETVENAEKYRADKLFLSSGAISPDGVIGSGIYYLLHRVMLRNSKKIFYLADHDKVRHEYKTILCDLSRVDYIISDYSFSPETKALDPDTGFIVV